MTLETKVNIKQSYCVVFKVSADICNWPAYRFTSFLSFIINWRSPDCIKRGLLTQLLMFFFPTSTILVMTNITKKSKYPCRIPLFYNVWLPFLSHSLISRQLRTWSDAALLCVWSGSALFADVPAHGLQIRLTQIDTMIDILWWLFPLYCAFIIHFVATTCYSQHVISNNVAFWYI